MARYLNVKFHMNTYSAKRWYILYLKSVNYRAAVALAASLPLPLTVLYGKVLLMDLGSTLP